MNTKRTLMRDAKIFSIISTWSSHFWCEICC